MTPPRLCLFLLTATLLSCGGGGTGAPSAESAAKMVAEAEEKIAAVALEANKAQWVAATHITDDTEALSAAATERSINLGVVYAKEAAKYDKVELPADVARKMLILKTGLTLATPADPKESAEVTRLAASLEGVYGKGKYCKTPDNCLDVGAVSRLLATSRKPDELLDVWKGWHAISPPMKKDFVRFVELSNKGAKELGFADAGAMWRAKYDMPPDAFAKEVDRLWEQVKPLYTSLHTYVRWKLREKYGDAVPANGPIPAHLLGNIWSQSWENVYDIVKPAGAGAGVDLTAILKQKKVDPVGMVKYGERFFSSLGFAPMPATFWTRSQFSKPRDREVVCHASAWDVDMKEDLRIKMCIEITGEEFAVVHHELGHNYYQRAYMNQPLLFRDSANDGFHEAVGDTIALSITPEYLTKIGFLAQPTDPSKDVGLLMQQALAKVAFLPFGLLIDQWRWKVFSGAVTPDQYNKEWWELRRRYQGVAPSVERTEADFDPGAKYHVPANVPYTRYFLAHILQFQFHRALAEAAGCKQPLHRCSIYDSKDAGKKLNAMLELGMSKPWQEALAALSGKREMDATAIIDYFAPLQKWLDEQNQGKPSGW